MRILFWSSTFLPQIGGIGVLAAQFLPAMRARGYEYIVVSSQGDADLPSRATQKEIPVHRFPFWQSLTDVAKIVEIRQQLAELKRSFAPDLIHLNGVGRDNFFYLLTARAHPAPLLVTLHGEWVSKADAIVRRTLQSAMWVAGCSNSVLERARRLAPEISTRSSCIYNATAEVSVLPEPIGFKAQRVLCLGRLSKEKGFDLAVSAFERVVKHFPQARLVIAGDGPERHSLTTQAAVAGLSKAVEFIGWVAPENIPALLNTATVIMMPSRTEALPMVALQAAQMARPVVGTQVGGVPEVVVHRQTGLLVDKENPRALAAAICFLFNHPESAVRMGQSARHRLQKHFAWKRHLNAYDRLYRKLLQADAAPVSAEN